MSDDNDIYGPTGSETRRLRKNAGQHTWPLRDLGGPEGSKGTESEENARVEYSRAVAERGEKSDIELPKNRPSIKALKKL